MTFTYLRELGQRDIHTIGTLDAECLDVAHAEQFADCTDEVLVVTLQDGTARKVDVL